MAFDPLACRTLPALLQGRAAERPDALAFVFLADGEEQRQELGYRELWTRARAIAARLGERGASGRRVLLLLSPGLDYVIAFWACQLAGAVAVPAYPPRPSRLSRELPRLRAIAADCDPALVLTDPGLRALMDGGGPGPGLEVLVPGEVDDAEAAGWQAPDVRDEDLAFLQYTSGSTAAPRGVKVTQAGVTANLGQIFRGPGGSEFSRGCFWLPPYHDMGLVGGLIMPVFMGEPVTLMAPLRFLAKPVRWLRAIARSGARYTAAPDSGYRLCVERVLPHEVEGLDLSGWRIAIDGAEPVRAETLRGFARLLAPCGFSPTAFYPSYGLAEGTLLVTGGEREEGARVERWRAADLEAARAVPAGEGDGEPEIRTLVGCGRAFGETRVRIVDQTSLRALPEREVGEIWFQGPQASAGYWGATDEGPFAARLEPGGEGPFVRTGDLGFLSGDDLFVTGRSKDLMVIDGRNLYPQDLETAAGAAHPAVRCGAVVAFSDEVRGSEQAIVICGREPRAGEVDPGEVLRAVQRRVSEEAQVAPWEVLLVRPGDIPRTSSGKLQRGRCRELYREGALTPIARSRPG